MLAFAITTDLLIDALTILVIGVAIYLVVAFFIFVLCLYGTRTSGDPTMNREESFRFSLMCGAIWLKLALVGIYGAFKEG